MGSRLLILSISSKMIKGAEFSALISALAEGTGLHTTPSYSTKMSLGTDSIASSCTWSGILSARALG